MKRQDFMGLLYRKVQEFETFWNRKQRAHGEDEWAQDMHEADWWEQFLIWLESE